MALKKTIDAVIKPKATADESVNTILKAEPVEKKQASEKPEKATATTAKAEPKAAETKKAASVANKSVTLKSLMNIRLQPSMDGEKVATLGAGTKLQIVKDCGDWLNVMVNGKSAYVLYEGGKYGEIQ